jgi:ferredoxin
MREAITNRLKQMSKALDLADEHTIVVMPLTDRPKGKDADIWEFTCDRCAKFCPPGVEKFETGSAVIHVEGVGQINITVGMCAECAAMEQV